VSDYLTDLVFTAFPSGPPYGGAAPQGDPAPEHRPCGPQALRAAAESVCLCLPVEAVATEVILMAGPRPGIPGTPPGQWRTLATFPLG
jgi:hypothetical protein